ncbi:MAG: transcriptional regulator, partial [Flavobacteriaceae bacterium]
DIEFNYTIEDNTLILDAYFLSKYQHIFKYEKVYVTIYVPVNKIVYFHHSTRNFIYDIDNIDDIYDTEMADHYFLMTEKGLDCTDCEEEEKDDEENDNDTESEESEF